MITKKKDFDLMEARRLLERTPSVLNALLRDLPESWLNATEGPDTWTPRDVVAHLVDLEEEAWIGRARHLLEHGTDSPFPTVDRTRFREQFDGRDVAFLLDLFTQRRNDSLAALDAMDFSDSELERVGHHSAFGEVKLRELLATWVVHDLTHIAQIVRTLAKRYVSAVGPWSEYLSVLRSSGSGGS